MELIKKNIHMDHMKCKAVTQVTLEEDVNISDNKPDVSKIVFEKGDIKIDEVKASQDHAFMRGKLLFSILYTSSDSEKTVWSMEGSIPFEEQINMEGLRPGDSVNVNWSMEDLSIGLINSRKISVRSLITFTLASHELYDMELPVDLSCDDSIEYRRKKINLWEIAVWKKDVFRIKEEMEIPKNLPNIFHIIWENVRPLWMEFKVLDGKIGVQGELSVFFLYEGEGDESPIRFYEAVLPFAGVVECSGCLENMIPVIHYQKSQQEMEIRPDFDGEQRIASVEFVFDLDIRLYEEENTEMISDVYGVTKEIETVENEEDLKSILVKNVGKQKVTGRIKIKSENGRIMQLVHSEADVVIDNTTIVDEGIEINGSITVRILYVTNDDAIPFSTVKEELPFTYTIEAPGIKEGCTYTIDPNVEQINVSMVDSEEIDVKALLSYHTVVFCNNTSAVIKDVTVSELNLDLLSKLPSIVIYIVKAGDSLWQIGKRYYVPVARIKELNGLTSDLIYPGDKLLIVKDFY
ncbi:MAG TPA: SPOCS domain-containing protein [Lachnospiraceae bacterium]|nr:SPOCS domain-containing protein [Lachnospiraceae bacterium]